MLHFRHKEDIRFIREEDVIIEMQHLSARNHLWSRHYADNGRDDLAVQAQCSAKVFSQKTRELLGITQE